MTRRDSTSRVARKKAAITEFFRASEVLEKKGEAFLEDDLDSLGTAALHLIRDRGSSQRLVALCERWLKLVASIREDRIESVTLSDDMEDRIERAVNERVNRYGVESNG